MLNDKNTLTEANTLNDSAIDTSDIDDVYENTISSDADDIDEGIDYIDEEIITPMQMKQTHPKTI